MLTVGLGLGGLGNGFTTGLVAAGVAGIVGFTTLGLTTGGLFSPLASTSGTEGLTVLGLAVTGLGLALTAAGVAEGVKDALGGDTFTGLGFVGLCIGLVASTGCTVFTAAGLAASVIVLASISSDTTGTLIPSSVFRPSPPGEVLISGDKVGLRWRMICTGKELVK
jgi:hypothetical protein